MSVDVSGLLRRDDFNSIGKQYFLVTFCLPLFFDLRMAVGQVIR